MRQSFYLGNCPERVMPGKLIQNLTSMSRVVGGDSPQTAAVMQALYRNIVQSDIDQADWITAELVKTVENTYRDVQIAFANETAMICEALGADVWRVRELVRKSPGREMLLPGAGVGGHCIPKDPWLLASSVRGYDVKVRLIPAARDINSSMPVHMLALLKERLKDLQGKRILVLDMLIWKTPMTHATPPVCISSKRWKMKKRILLSMILSSRNTWVMSMKWLRAATRLS